MHSPKAVLTVIVSLAGVAALSIVGSVLLALRGRPDAALLTIAGSATGAIASLLTRLDAPHGDK